VKIMIANKLGLEPIIVMLFIGVFAAMGVTIYCEHMFKDDGQMFQVASGLVVAFSSALFSRMKPRDDKKADKVEVKPVVVGEDKPSA
jgi:hypothetical protein